MIVLLSENDKFIIVKSDMKPENFQLIKNIPILDSKTQRVSEERKSQISEENITFEYQKIVKQVKSVELMGYGVMNKDQDKIHYTYKIYF